MTTIPSRLFFIFLVFSLSANGSDVAWRAPSRQAATDAYQSFFQKEALELPLVARRNQNRFPEDTPSQKIQRWAASSGMADRLGASTTYAPVKYRVLAYAPAPDREKVQKELTRMVPALGLTSQKITLISFVTFTPSTIAATLTPHPLGIKDQWEMLVSAHEMENISKYVGFHFLLLHMAHEEAELDLTPEGTPLKTEINREIAALWIQGRVYSQLASYDRLALKDQAKALDRSANPYAKRYEPVFHLFDLHRDELLERQAPSDYAPWYDFITRYNEIDPGAYSPETVAHHLERLLAHQPFDQKTEEAKKESAPSSGILGALQSLDPHFNGKSEWVIDTGPARRHFVRFESRRIDNQHYQWIISERYPGQADWRQTARWEGRLSDDPILAIERRDDDFKVQLSRKNAFEFTPSPESRVRFFMTYASESKPTEAMALAATAQGPSIPARPVPSLRSLHQRLKQDLENLLGIPVRFLPMISQTVVFWNISEGLEHTKLNLNTSLDHSGAVYNAIIEAIHSSSEATALFAQHLPRLEMAA